MKRMFIAAALILVTLSLAAGQGTAEKKADENNSTKEMLVKTAKEWVAAENGRDGPALYRLLSDDFAGTAPSGDRVTKEMIVPDPKGPGGGLSFTAGDFVARAYGDMGVVTGNGTWKD